MPLISRAFCKICAYSHSIPDVALPWQGPSKHELVLRKGGTTKSARKFWAGHYRVDTKPCLKSDTHRGLDDAEVVCSVCRLLSFDDRLDCFPFSFVLHLPLIDLHGELVGHVAEERDAEILLPNEMGLIKHGSRSDHRALRFSRHQHTRNTQQRRRLAMGLIVFTVR